MHMAVSPRHQPSAHVVMFKPVGSPTLSTIASEMCRSMWRAALEARSPRRSSSCVGHQCLWTKSPTSVISEPAHLPGEKPHRASRLPEVPGVWIILFGTLQYLEQPMVVCR